MMDFVSYEDEKFYFYTCFDSVMFRERRTFVLSSNQDYLVERKSILKLFNGLGDILMLMPQWPLLHLPYINWSRHVVVFLLF